VQTALISVVSTAEGHETRLASNWDGRALPGDDAPREPFAVPPPPDGYPDLKAFLLGMAGSSPGFRIVGQSLYEALITGDIREALKDAWEKGPVRLLLRFDSDDCNALPWELMRDGTRRIFTDAAQPTARVAEFYNPDLAPPGLCWPLRVLLVAGTEDGTIDLDMEIYHVRDAFRRVCGLVDFEVLRRPTRAQIRDKCQTLRPHVFHFVGHGDLDDELGGYLRLDQKVGGAKQWTASDIGDDLSEGRPRLAILNACHSGEQSERDGTWAAAEGLARLRVPAVISMQGPIRDDAAQEFARGLYETLAAGQPLDVAVARARLKITDVAADNRRDYSLPCLILGAPPDRILDLSRDPGTQLTHRPLHTTRYFVDRNIKRRRLWDQLQSDEPVARRIYAVTGPEHAGKGSLVRWCLGIAAVWGHSVAHVSLEADESVDSVAFLRDLATALPAIVADQVRISLNEFRDHLDTFEREREERDKANLARDSPRSLYDEIRGILATAQADPDVMIGIDCVDRIEGGEWSSCAVPGLVQPIAHGEAGPVRLIVTLPDRHSRFTPRDFEDADVEEIKIPLFPQEEYAELMSQWLRAQGYLRMSFESTVENARKQIGSPWDTLHFEGFDTMARALKWTQEE
jgi:hypothetical protein